LRVPTRKSEGTAGTRGPLRPWFRGPALCHRQQATAVRMLATSTSLDSCRVNVLRARHRLVGSQTDVRHKFRCDVYRTIR